MIREGLERLRSGGVGGHDQTGDPVDDVEGEEGKGHDEARVEIYLGGQVVGLGEVAAQTISERFTSLEL